MFERFTAQARQVIVLAQEEARGLGQDHIGTEHLLLGVVAEADGLGAQVLGGLEITAEAVRERVVELVGPAGARRPGQIPFTARGKQVLELSLREALSLGHNYIGTEHILLALAAVDEGTAARILVAVGVDPAVIRTGVMALLPGSSEGETAGGAARRSAVGRALGRMASAYRIEVGPGPHLRAVLMAAGARALDDGRDRIELDDLLIALARDERAAERLAELGLDPAHVRRAFADPPGS